MQETVRKFDLSVAILSFQQYFSYRNDPTFSDSQVWANSVDPEIRLLLSAPRGAVWSGSALFAILSAPFGQIILW